MIGSSTPAEPGIDHALPLVMGVTGHCDLLPAHRERLEEAARGVFEHFARIFPSTPLVLLSSLAEGAEQLAVNAAFQFAERTSAKVELVVPLPMPPDDYKKTFRHDDSRREFDKLLARARRWFVVDDDRRRASSMRTDGEQRVGLYVEQNCQLLLAFWDGKQDEADGVWEAVAFQLEGPPELIHSLKSPLDLPETGPVIQVVTPHANAPNLDDAFSGQVLFPRDPERLRGRNLLQKMLPHVQNWFEPAWHFSKAAMLSDLGELERIDPDTSPTRGARTYKRILRRMETFNRDGLLQSAWLAEEQPKSESWVIPRRKRLELTEAARAELHRFARADALANLNHTRLFTALWTLLVTAACWSIIFYSQLLLAHSSLPAQLGSRYHLLERALEAGYLFAFGFGLLYWLWERHSPDPFWEQMRPRRLWERFKADFHSKYLDYRALAEGLRVQLFWRICGIPERANDHYLRKQKSELEWVRSAVQIGQILEGPPAALPGEPVAPERSLALALAHWVKDQKRYFSSKARWNHDRDRGMGYLGQVVLFVFFGLAALREPIKFHGMIVCMTLVWIFGGLAAIYARVYAFSEHAKGYGWMSVLFDNARRRLVPLVFADHLLRRNRAADLDAARQTNANRHGTWARAFNHYRPLWDQVFERLGEKPHDPARYAEAIALVHREAHALLLELGKDALAENGDWVLLHRDRAVELPQT